MVREQEAEEELAAADRLHGVGPPCSGETPLPDREEERLIREKGDKRRASMSRFKVSSLSLNLQIKECVWTLCLRDPTCQILSLLEVAFSHFCMKCNISWHKMEDMTPMCA